MQKIHGNYKDLRNKLIKAHGEDLSKWMQEYDAVCLIKETIEEKMRELALRATLADKIKIIKKIKNRRVQR